MRLCLYICKHKDDCLFKERKILKVLLELIVVHIYGNLYV